MLRTIHNALARHNSARYSLVNTSALENYQNSTGKLRSLFCRFMLQVFLNVSLLINGLLMVLKIY